MIVRELRLRNFRNHAATDLSLGAGLNALIGENGQGKTNVLEAISYLGLTKSFSSAADATVLRFGAEGFVIRGVIEGDAGRVHTVHVRYDGDSAQKQYTIDDVRPETLASAVGRFPVVVLAPAHGAIAAGAPAERRRFMDLVLSQVSRIYLEDLLEYRRTLRHRNRMLAEARRSERLDPAALAAWTANLATHGARIVARRLEFVTEFAPYMEQAHEAIASTGEHPAMAYVSPGVAAAASGFGEIEHILTQRLEEREAEERRRGLTLAGPHRDELRFSIDGRDVPAYASQGQQKTLLVALKVAEFLYVKDRKNEAPVVLLDDVFGELDLQRGRHLLDVMGNLGQTVITTTDEEVFHGAVHWNDNHRRFSVVQGRCSRVAAG